MNRVDSAPSPVPSAFRPHVADSAFGVTVDQTTRLIRVVGEFDTAAVGHFLAAASILVDGRVGDVAVDLGGLRFIDAAGLGALVRVRNSLRRGGHQLVLRGVGPATRRVFQAGCLSELLPAAA